MLTHIDPKNNLPTMVDVTGKTVTERAARAECTVQLPPEMRPFLQGEEMVLKKGPVFQTAIIAGTMAVKKTAEMIPFCHPLPIESCKFNVRMDESMKVTIDCTVKTTFKTGVEMEALHGALNAALTIYDMCKAVSHQIVIQEARLVTKTGGKRTVLDRPTYGLVLTGGKSERMDRDKALIEYKGKAHALYIQEVLKAYCEEVYLSARKGQWEGTPLEASLQIEDSVFGQGPMVGILSAFEKHPEANWIVVACDLVHFGPKTMERLLAQYDPTQVATAFRNIEKGFPEPLCTLYTPVARAAFLEAQASGVTCPVKVLRNASVKLVDQGDGIDLANINTVEEFEGVQHEVY